MFIGGGAGLRLLRFKGVDVVLDFSAILMIALFMLPQYQYLSSRGWPTGESLTVVVAVSALFIGSILVHELGHAWMGLLLGAQVSSIRLHIFGGATHFTRMPDSEGKRFWISAIGPISNFALWGMFYGLTQASVQSDFTDIRIPVWPVIFSYMATANFFLAVFNALPGYPLDGGQALRSAVIFFTKKDLLAARIVMVTGCIVGGLIALWAVQGILERDTISALFRGFIAFWIIQGSIQQFRSTQQFQPTMPGKPDTRPAPKLAGIPVGQVMTVPPVAVALEMPLNEFIRYTEQVNLEDKSWLPVLRDGYLMGVINRKLARRVSESELAATTVEKTMIARRNLLVVKVEDDIITGRDALKASSSDQPVGVLGDGGTFAGFLFKDNL